MLQDIVAGQSRVLNTLGLLNLIVAERVAQEPRETLLQRVEYEVNQRTLQNLIQNSQGQQGNG